MSDGAVSNEPVVAIPTPISVEPRVAPAEAAEVSRQAEEAKVAVNRNKTEPAKAEAPEEKSKPLSIKESLAKARAKIDADPTPAKPISVAAKDAEPAPVAKAADAKAEPVADKTEPAAKVESTAPTRGEDGKFVSSKPVAEPVAEAAPAKAAEPTKSLPSHTAEAPPTRFSAVAKEKWAESPEEVRAEVTRAVTELTKGFEKHRSAAERDASLNEFHEMAAKGGTDVKTALSKYVGMEQALRNPDTRDKGIEAIFANIGISPRDWAAKLLNQTPDQARSQSDATIRDLTARLEKAEAAVGSIHQEREQTRTHSTTEAVTKFAADNPRFEELADDIAFFLNTGKTKDLAEAYKMAERLNPAPVAQAEATVAAASSAPAIIKPTLVSDTTAHTRDAGTKSIAGTPTAGSDPVRKQPSSSIKEAIRRAAAAAR